MRMGEKPPKLRHQAYNSFTRHLLAGGIHPGQFVSQRELVALTGLTLGAIRELIPRLEAEGLIKTVPQRGLQIAHIDLELVREAFQFRLFIEREAVALFCETATDADITALRQEHETMLARAQSAGENAEIEAQAQTIDWNMHNTIVAALGNKIIWRAYNANSIKMRLISQERFRIGGHVVRVMREHLDVLTAIQSRQPQKAVDAITHHINNARALALRL